MDGVVKNGHEELWDISKTRWFTHQKDKTPGFLKVKIIKLIGFENLFKVEEEISSGCFLGLSPKEDFEILYFLKFLTDFRKIFQDLFHGRSHHFKKV